MTNDIENDLKSLRNEMAQIRGDLTEVAGTLRTLVGHGGEELNARVREAAKNLHQRTSGATQSITKEIEERPLSSALAAFGVGVALGVLLRQRG